MTTTTIAPDLVAEIEAVFEHSRFAHLAERHYVEWCRTNDERAMLWCSRAGSVRWLTPRPAETTDALPLCPFCEEVMLLLGPLIGSHPWFLDGVGRA